MRTPLVLYCCTYSKDLKRVERLLESIEKYNKSSLPVYISVPAKDIDLFRENLSKFSFTLINEEDILKKNTRIDTTLLYQKRGWIQQQIIKSEFWRLDLSDNYLVMDSDCLFIRDFTVEDFMAEENVPYSIINEGKEVLQSTERFGPSYARAGYIKDRAPIRDIMGRKGIIYDFGYAPFLWSKKVWESLDENFLKPNNMSFLDAILTCDSEFTWYGESLLKYRAIPLYPRNELFKHYHYEHQYWVDKSLGYNEKILQKDFMGVVYQSNWQIWKDFGNSKKISSKLLKSLKRAIKYLQFKIKTF